MCWLCSIQVCATPNVGPCLIPCHPCSWCCTGMWIHGNLWWLLVHKIVESFVVFDNELLTCTGSKCPEVGFTDSECPEVGCTGSGSDCCCRCLGRGLFISLTPTTTVVAAALNRLNFVSKKKTFKSHINSNLNINL